MSFGSWKATVPLRGEEHVTEAAGGRVGDRRAVPALRDGLARGCAPTRARPAVACAASWSAAARPDRACSQRKRPSPDCIATWREHVARQLDDVVADLDLAVVGGHHQRGAGGQRLEQRADEVVDPRAAPRRTGAPSPYSWDTLSSPS